MTLEDSDKEMEHPRETAGTAKWDLEEIYSSQTQRAGKDTSFTFELASMSIGDQASQPATAKDKIDEYSALSFLHSWSKSFDEDQSGVVSKKEILDQLNELKKTPYAESQIRDANYLLSNFDRLSNGNPDGISLKDSRQRKADLKDEALLQTIKEVAAGSTTVDSRLGFMFPAEDLNKHPEMADRINKLLEEQACSARIEVHTKYHSAKELDRPYTGEIRIKDSNGKMLHTIHARSMMMY